MHGLCLCVGEWDTRTIAARMPQGLFSDWQKFYEQEPFGAWWENWLMARPAHNFGVANFAEPPPFSSYFHQTAEEAKAEEKSRHEAKFASTISFFDNHKG